MKLKQVFTALLSVLIILCLGAAQLNLSGKWSGNLIKADSTYYPLNYNFLIAGDSIGGTAKSELGEFPIEGGTIDTAGFHFKVTVNGLDIQHHGRYYGDSVGMDITLNGSMVHCTLTRPVN